jgi:hypothetical protein
MKRLFLGTQTFDLVTLILNFDLVLKNFNLGYIFWTKCVKALILEMENLYEDTFLLVPRFFTLFLNFDLVLKNFNLGYIFWTMGDKILIFYI